MVCVKVGPFSEISFNDTSIQDLKYWSIAGDEEAVCIKIPTPGEFEHWDFGEAFKRTSKTGPLQMMVRRSSWVLAAGHFSVAASSQPAIL